MNSGLDSDFHDPDGEASPVIASAWWLACPARVLVWARLSVRESGVAEVLDCDGRVLVYDSEDSARTALLDAEFRAFDGLDEDDATSFGLLLDELAPPEGEHDDDLIPQMMRVLELSRR